MSVAGAESLLSLEEVLQAVDGIHVLGSGDFSFTSVQTDSRLVEDGTLFVPLIGEFQDGHKYIPQAIEKGASVIFICTKNFEADGNFFAEISQKNPDVFFIAVENTLHALQKAAARYVEKFPDLIKIAVTGSSGKTTTKEITAAIFAQKYSVISNRGNLNSETGLPLSVFGIRKEHKVGIFEMGMNRKDEIKEISAVLKPRFAIVTNIGTAHVGLLGSRENIAAEKAHVFDWFNGIGTAVIPCDDDFTEFLKDQADGKIVLYGEGSDENVRIVSDLGLEGTELEIDGVKTRLSLPGKYNCKNALGAIALARVLGLTAQEIASGIESLKGMFGRSEVLHGKYTVIQDCYNANPDSMEKALEFISSVNDGKKKIFVLGDMLELGESSARDHAAAGRLAVECHADAIVFVGTEMKAAYDAAVELAGKNAEAVKLFYVAEKDDAAMEKAASYVKSVSEGGDNVLVKGSRGMALERVVKLLEVK